MSKRRSQIETATCDYGLPYPYNPSSTYVCGIDPSKSDAGPGSDYTALVLLEREREEYGDGYLEQRLRLQQDVKWKTHYPGLTGRQRQLKHLLDTGQVEGDQAALIRADLGEPERPEPRIRVAWIGRFQSITSTELLELLRWLKSVYPSLKHLAVESFESEQMDGICRRVHKRMGDTGTRQNIRGQTRFGRGPLDMTAYINTPTPGMQQEGFSALSRLFSEQEIELPARGEHASTLKSELLALGMSFTPVRGQMRFEATRGKDDLAYALMHAVYEMRRADNCSIDWDAVRARVAI
jgi:hypothetical protein